MRASILIPLLLIIGIVSTQDCFHGENGVCCLCGKHWQCKLPGFACSHQTTDFNINLQISTTERIIVSIDSNGTAVPLTIGLILGVVLAIVLCLIAVIVPGIRNYLVRLYVAAAVRYYSTRSTEVNHRQNVELGELPQPLADDVDLD